MKKENKDILTSALMIYGRHPIVDAIRLGKTIEKIWLLEGTRGELEKELRGLSKEAGIPMVYAPKDKLDKMTQRANHQGVVAQLAVMDYYKLEDVLPTIYDKGEVPLILLLDDVTDVRNFGAIARSAEVLGAHALVIPQSGGAAINADAMKTSAGALNEIPVCREKSLHSAATFLVENGIALLGSDLNGKHLLHELDLTIPVAFLIGSEGRGLNPALLRLADHRFKIPQSGKTDSLNVSVASSLMLYETQRQRMFGTNG